MRGLVRFSGLLLGGLLLCACPAAGQSNIEVGGIGFFKDRALDQRLAFLHDVGAKEEVRLDSAILEDSAFLLLEQVRRDGFLRPEIEGVFEVGEEERREVWTHPYALQLEAGFEADHARFEINPGVLYYYESVEVSGIDIIPGDRLEQFFIPGGALINRKAHRIFTPSNFNRRLGRILSVLEERGYRSARETGRDVERDPETGAVRARVGIEPGPRHEVGEVTTVILDGDREVDRRKRDAAGEVLTPDWEREARRSVRNEFYHKGYPDVRVDFATETVEDGEAIRVRDVVITVRRGEKVRLTGVRFEGDPETRRTTLRRKVRIGEGEPLNRLEADAARRKLMGSGIYRNVGMRLEPGEGEEREVVYTLEPNERKTFGVLFGWGSFELARVGFRWRHRNPFGRTHNYSIRAKQSFRATRLNGDYTIPQVFGTSASAFFELDYDVREELNFDRESRGASIGTRFPLGSVHMRMEYKLSREITERRSGAESGSDEEATVAGIIVGASIDRRDDFLMPTSGYNLYARWKLANGMIGSGVDFQKFELGGSYHKPLTDSLIAHSGLRFGTILSGSTGDIPFNERFFPGGENSVRGFEDGAAAPLDAAGDEIGAETFVVGNLELEQRIVSDFSLVGFLDGVSFGRDGFLGGEGDTLFSAGAGLRYRSPIGPVRLEYGHNLNPRSEDPDGQVHFSIGFPF